MSLAMRFPFTRRAGRPRGHRLTVAWSTLCLLAAAALGSTCSEAGPEPAGFRPIPTRFIAALAEPDATSGTGAEHWGLWPVDPGPRGVRLSRFGQLQAAGGMAPARWQFDARDWWLEENGLIMEPPQFPLAPGRYLVTGDREVTTVLTVYPDDANGQRRWELADGATLYDVTHLGCRSVRYTPAAAGGDCSPANAPRDAFRVAPGAAMPPVAGCSKQDYAVLFVIGVEAAATSPGAKAR
jgi:hypothetical protein